MVRGVGSCEAVRVCCEGVGVELWPGVLWCEGRGENRLLERSLLLFIAVGE